MDSVQPRDVQQLLQYFATYTYKAKESHPIALEAMKKSIQLMSLDYEYMEIDNSSGELSDRYPSHLIVLESEKNPQNGNCSDVCGTGVSHVHPPNTIYESALDVSKLRDLIAKARFARCRSRFPVPVILYHGKYICRSATLSGGPELYGRSGLNFFFSGNNENMPVQADEDGDEIVVPRTQSEWQLFDKVRNQDIRLLKTLNIGTIIDFMVEKKKIKFGVYVTSSEKVDKENRYIDFNIVSLPYPGCEFFKEFRENDHSGDGLVYDWSHPQVDTVIGIPPDAFTAQLKIDWDKYKAWDLTELTKNYMKLLVHYVQESSSGILIHCISGWDRTPLFVSLLRLSLWADGVIHQSLSATEILYLTLAYDWMLFGHHLVDRLSRGEEILLFCFHFLLHLAEAEFSTLLKGNNHCSVPHRPCPSVRHDSDSLDFVELDSDRLLCPQDSTTSSDSSLSSRNQEPPVFFYNLPDYNLSEASNGNYNFAGHLPTWSMLSVPAELGGEPQCTPTAPSPAESSRASPVASPSPCTGSSSSAVGANCSPRLSRHHTSPMAVPNPGRFRNRQDSSGSVSTGSWQIISESGSPRGGWSSASNCGDPSSYSQSIGRNSNSGGAKLDGNLSTQSSVTVVEEMSSSQNSSYLDISAMRRERLKAVQSLFYNTYHSTAPLPSEGLSLGTFLGNFAERVGIFPAAHS